MHPTHDDLVLHYYGESGDETARLDLHLATCAACRTALHQL
jgi:Putative zinc-finger